jgi:hypothetical protein
MDEARAQVGKALQHVAMLRELLLQLVSKMPEPSAPIPTDWAETHRTVQEQARSVLHEIEPSEARWMLLCDQIPSRLSDAFW